MVEQERIKVLKDYGVKKGDFVLYWMQASQRVEYNHALSFSIEKSNELKLPLLVVFCLVPSFPNANLRHYFFMLEGLKETFEKLESFGIGTILEVGDPVEIVTKYSSKASLVITDMGYTRIQRSWRSEIIKGIKSSFFQVETDIVVPVEVASNKEEFSAATFRRKIIEKAPNFLNEIKIQKPLKKWNKMFYRLDIQNLLTKINCDRSVSSSKFYRGGYSEAKNKLEDFLTNKLKEYELFKNDPTKSFTSDLSPYLHFGQISPVEIVLKVLKVNSNIKNPFLDELIVRRELAINFTYYNENYDKFDSLPNWAKESLKKHIKDKRKYLYTLEELENSKTHDRFWNSAQKEMVIKGKMHGYMRMYWGKKVIEWSKTPEEAYEILIYLNDKYELDGRDANGYAGISWCFGKHDRPFKEREIFGKVRYMSENGLKRKFEVEKYVNMIKSL
ncbi:MAG: deoxyribodipyrimidine photo-lyase [candidate division WOR-3 bacterium]